jgi:uncharacterized protein (DUF58 family)
MAGLTQRGRLVLTLAGALYLVAWAFGSRSLYPVAIGLALAALGGRLWVSVSRQAVSLQRRLGSGERLEGEDVEIGLEARPQRYPGPRAVEIVEQIGRLGDHRVRLTKHGSTLVARYVLSAVPRGRYRIAAARAIFEDPFGLARAETNLGAETTLLVFPRLVELGRLFSEAGGGAQSGGRLLLRRMSGFDLHSVREYQQGESLRKVHWPTTARRGALMVKELEDAPHDEVAVLLDADARVAVPGAFDAQVRAAGSILRVHALKGRRAALTVTSSPAQTCHVASFDGEWRLALELLASAEADGTDPLESFLGRDASAAAHAAELVAVTALLTPQLEDALRNRALSRRPTSLVLIDAGSFRSGESAPRRDPALLRLHAAGVPVTVVRRGDDLTLKLSGLAEAVAAHG